MADRIFLTLTCIVLVAAAGGATAMELDTLLPTQIPGYGTPRLVSVLDRTHPEFNPVNIDIAGITLAPKIEADAGFDSSPNGAGNASSLFDMNPSMLALDTELGLGAYVAGTYTTYPEASKQNLASYTVAIGERAVFPRETITLSAAAVSEQETSFALNTVSVQKPIGVLVKDVRGSDAIIFGMATLTPELSVTNYRFADVASQNRTDYRQSLTTEIAS